MSVQENPPPDENPPTDKPKVNRASERKRAYRIRQKPTVERTKEDIEWLANYDATKQRRGFQATEIDDDTTDVGGAVLPDDAADLPPPPPPPRIENTPKRDDDEPRGGSDWQRQRKAGRDKAVTLFASQWKSGLDFMNEQIRMSGGTPFIDSATLWPAIYETVDTVLPDKVVIKPAMIAAVGSTVIIAQRIARHKKIAEAYARGEQPTSAKPATPQVAPLNANCGDINCANGPAFHTRTTDCKTRVLVPTPDVGKPDAVAVTEESTVPPPVEPVIKIASDALTQHMPGPNEVY